MGPGQRAPAHCSGYEGAGEVLATRDYECSSHEFKDKLDLFFKRNILKILRQRLFLRKVLRYQMLKAVRVFEHVKLHPVLLLCPSSEI